jgi:hypothetical protein
MSLSSPASSLQTHESLDEMNPFVCALTLVLSCGSKSASALNVSHAAIAFTDTYYTQRSFALCPTPEACRYVEGNPLTRPFQRNGKATAFESTYVGLSAAAFLAQKMRTSHSQIFRRLWWLPQSVLLGGSIYGAYSQAKAY